MFSRLSGALVALLVTYLALSFVVGPDATFESLSQSTGVAAGGLELSVAGLRAFGDPARLGLGNKPDHPQPHRPRKKINNTTTTAPPATTTSATSTTASSTTTAPVTTTTQASTTTAAPTTTTTAPSTTTTSTGGAPPGAVVIQPGTNPNSIVDSKPAGTTFYFTAGTHYPSDTIEPQTGDVFLGQAGAVLNGADKVEFAFRSSASDVLISGLIIEKFANEAQTGAVDGAGTDWSIMYNEIRYNWGGGITLGDGYQVVGNYIHHNRQIGIKGKGVNVLIEGNEIAYNNYLDEYSMSWEAGGTKFLNTTNLIVRDNYVHDNHGHGLWTDANNVNVLYENNTVLNNYGAGIFHEISHSAVIRFNRVEGNAWLHTSGGIKVTNSDNVEVHGNTLINNDGGIHAAQNDRPGYDLKNLWVHDNVITFSQGWSGITVNHGGEIFYTGYNNTFDNNVYTLGSNAEPFYWMFETRTTNEWIGYGLDANGTFN